MPPRSVSLPNLGALRFRTYVTLFTKQSVAFFVLPLMSFYLFTNYKTKIREIKPVLYLLVLSSIIYFTKVYLDTGNPSFLFNSIFKSPLYPIDNFHATNFGPSKDLYSVLTWPILGQFTERYGEGFVNIWVRYLFSFFTIAPYILSLYYFVKNRKIINLVALISVLFWSYYSGYSRYQLAMNATIIFVLIYENGISIKFIPRLLKIPIVLILIIGSLLSMKTDFSWRHYWVEGFDAGIKSISPISNSSIVNFKEGLSYIFNDKPRYMIAELKVVDSLDVDSVVFFSRGPAAYYSYLLGLKYEIPVINTVSLNEERNILESELVSNRLKRNLNYVNNKENRVLLVVEKHMLDYINSLSVVNSKKCQYFSNGEKVKYFQNDYYFENIVLYYCSGTER